MQSTHCTAAFAPAVPNDFPAPHSVQEVCAFWSWYKPAAHSTQFGCPAASCANPNLQSAHSLPPSLGKDFPGTQFWHDC